MKIIKKDGRLEDFTEEKVIKAITKSANRVMYELTEADKEHIIKSVKKEMQKLEKEELTVNDMHNIVELVLEKWKPKVAKSYREFRNYKKDFVNIMDDTYKYSQSVRYVGERENANMDSSLVSTQRSLIYNHLNTKFYEKFFLNQDEIQASNDGYIYIHDKSARLDTINCCLADVGTLMDNGFEMGNMWYTEPKTLDVAFDVLGDIILSASAQQYGGFTVPEVDKILAKYAKKSYDKYYKEYLNMLNEFSEKYASVSKHIVRPTLEETAHEKAWKKLVKEAENGYQGIEYKLNTVGSSRGDYGFITFTFGLATDEFGKMIAASILKVHQEGQGKPGFKKHVLFPKLVFLFDENMHGPGKEHNDLFNKAIECSGRTMYPDYLSLTGEGYVPSMYKKYGKAISPMGCRAFLSPWYENGGMYPQDENDKPVFVGRFNCGVVSLNLIMIYAKAKQENKEFYEVLDYYLEMIRNIHKRTYDFLGEKKASTNPMGFCQGGFYGGTLQPNEKIRPILKAATFSFGITALNELEQLHHKKSLVEDGSFSLEVMNYINNKITEYKEKDGILYAIYGTPAESLAQKQVHQFRTKYGIVKDVSDREYVSNSFHTHVSEEISPILKQDLEERFWNYFNGGKIQYCRYNLGYNKKAIETLVLRAMQKGFYEGVNLNLNYCDECGHQFIDGNKCPKCGSEEITQVNRVNGYLGYSRVHGKTRLNDGKMAEIADRKSM